MIRRLLQLAAFPALLLIFLLNGCSSFEHNSNGDPYVIQHHTWWNYYQRGRLYLGNQQYASAARDFETALGIRPGARYAYPHDRWRVRTYGMHTLESYFPHRELGVCLYFQGRHMESLQRLETSIQTEPSARAKFYLNRIQKELAIASAPPPNLTLIPTDLWTSRRTILLEGVASGTNAIAGINIAGVPEFIEFAKPDIHFARTLELTEGTNCIATTVLDVSGKTTTSNRTILADFTPPQIQLSRTGSSLEILCHDNLGLKQLILNGNQTLPRKREYTLSIPLPAQQALNLSLEDYAGNRIEWTLSKKELEHLALHPAPTAPKIHLTHAGQTITLFNTEYELDIRGEDDVALTTLQLNGEDLLHRPSPLLRISRRIPLTLGTNLLSVVAEDNHGNFTKKQITVIRRNPEYLDTRYRLSALQTPITGELSTIQTSQRINRLISHELSAVPPRFFMLASADEEDHLKDEQNLSAGEMADPRALLKASNRLDAELVFRTRSVEDAPGRTIYTQVFSVDGSKALFIEDVYFENPDELAAHIQRLVMKIEQRFPLAKARVSKLKNRLMIDAGSEQGLAPGMRFLVVRSDGDPRAGHVVLHKDRPAELIISEVESKRARVIIPKNHPEESVINGDVVFSR